MSKARKLTVPVRSYTCKLKNRRVTGGLMEDGTILWSFKRLGRDGGVYVERVRLSVEAVKAMMEIFLTIAGDDE